EATERRHPVVDGGYQPVQQEAKTQPTAADAPQEESKHDDAAQHKRPRPSPGPGGPVGDLPWPPCQGSIPDAPAPSRATHGTAGARPCVAAGLALGHASDRHAVALSPCVARVFPASPGRASLEELLVGKRIVGLAA